MERLKVVKILKTLLFLLILPITIVIIIFYIILLPIAFIIIALYLSFKYFSIRLNHYYIFNDSIVKIIDKSMPCIKIKYLDGHTSSWDFSDLKLKKISKRDLRIAKSRLL